MKALVVEIKDRYAAVLLEDGLIKKVKNVNYTIGEVIEVEQKKFTFEGRSKKKFIAILASAATFFILCGVGVWSYYTPYIYVSLDVNPSIEYSVNRYGRVLSAKGVNDDGKNVLQTIGLDSIENSTIENAVETTINEISTEGYFATEDEGGIVIATASEDSEKAEELATDLEDVADTVTEEKGEVVEVESESVGLERVMEARELGVTPGKLNLVEKLVESAQDPTSINIEEWLDKPVKDIMKACKENKKEQSITEEEETTTELNTLDSMQEETTAISDAKNNDKKKNINNETTQINTQQEQQSTTSDASKKANASEKSNNNTASENGNKKNK